MPEESRSRSRRIGSPVAFEVSLSAVVVIYNDRGFRPCTAFHGIDVSIVIFVTQNKT